MFGLQDNINRNGNRAIAERETRKRMQEVENNLRQFDKDAANAVQRELSKPTK